MSKKAKIFNYRPLLFSLVFLILGIISANYFHTRIYLAIILLVVAVGVLLFYAILNKNIIILIVALVSVVIGIGGFEINRNRYDNYNECSNGCVVSGRVDSYNANNSTLIILDVKIDNADFNGSIYLKYTGADLVTDMADYYIVFVGDINKKINYIGDEIPNAYYIKNNVKYIMQTEEIILADKDVTIATKIKDRIKENLSKGLDNENTELIYSTLFGDKSELSYTTKTVYNASGMAHILAVSGLHVGLIVACLVFVLKLLKCNKYLRFVLIFIFLIFYSYLCAWSVSVIRATIMATVLLLAPLCNREYDSLSSISLAGIIILLITPSAIFDISFLLSFMCVFGISMFYTRFVKLLKKCKINNLVTNLLSLSLIVNFSTIFIMIYYFGEENFMGIIANIFILPLFSIVFSICFIVIMLSLVLPFITFVLNPMNYVISFVTLLASLFASINNPVTAINVSYLSIIIYATALFFLSKYNVKSISTKCIGASVIVLLLICQILINNSVLLL